MTHINDKQWIQIDKVGGVNLVLADSVGFLYTLAILFCVKLPLKSGIAFCVEDDVDISQPAVIKHGCIFGLIVTFTSEGYIDVSLFLLTTLSRQTPVEL